MRPSPTFPYLGRGGRVESCRCAHPPQELPPHFPKSPRASFAPLGTPTSSSAPPHTRPVVIISAKRMSPSASCLAGPGRARLPPSRDFGSIPHIDLSLIPSVLEISPLPTASLTRHPRHTPISSTTTHPTPPHAAGRAVLSAAPAIPPVGHNEIEQPLHASTLPFTAAPHSGHTPLTFPVRE